MTVAKQDVLIQIKELHTHFFLAEGVLRAVNGVNLEIRRGRVLGVVGESGCGKTMLSYSLLQLVPPPGRIVSGDILYHPPPQGNGSSNRSEVINITQLEPKGKQIRNIRGNQISMVFQEPMTAMSPVLTVGSQIGEAIRLHQKVSKAEARNQTIEMLKRVRMPDPHKVVDAYPFQLSGGMRQRAVIAMALSCRPNLLIADEPTTALDVTTEAQILELIRDLQQELGMAVMYITHNLGVVAEMADEVAVMYLGRVVEQASVQSIFLNPMHPYTQGLIKSVPRLEEAVAHSGERRRLEAIKGMLPNPYSELKGCPFAPRCPAAKKGVCDRIEPRLIELQDGHRVRCHLYDPQLN